MKKIYLAAMAVAAFTMSSCSQDEVLNTAPDAGPQAISFNGAYLGNAAETRGIVANLENLKSGTYDAGLGVFANYTKTEDYTAGTSTWTNTFMNNQNVTWDATSQAWTYDPGKYWPTAGEKVSFVAYAPYTANQDNATAIAHEVSSAIADQTDLVVSDVEANKTSADNNGQVAFTMKHVLSKIGLKMNQANLPNNYSITLTSVQLGNNTESFYTGGSYNAVDGKGTWTTTESSKQALTWVSEDLSNGGKVTNATETASTSNNADKFLFVIPQDFSTSTLPVHVEYDLTVDAGATMHYEFDGTIAQEFVKGNAYLITFTMDYDNLGGGTGGGGEEPDPDKPVKITFDVTTVADWTPAGDGTSVEIK